MVQCPAWQQTFRSHKSPDRFWGPPNLLSVGSFSGIMQLSPLSAEFKNMRIYTSYNPHSFTECTCTTSSFLLNELGNENFLSENKNCKNTKICSTKLKIMVNLFYVRLRTVTMSVCPSGGTIAD
jgi:hypothetical protein